LKDIQKESHIWCDLKNHNLVKSYKSFVE
jgi:hypothetical protein